MSALKKMVLLLTAVAVSVPLWAKVELEYFYADDGTLTGRAVNGVRQNFVYDKRGQLLAVKDAKGNDIERYVYDPAGNILSKTIGGVTTRYTYDKANQLLTSTRNGKVTRYEYDAAGRLIREGDKVYFYGYQDKILTVTVNGKKKLTFDYHMDGQLASAGGNGKSEEFLWDGLALIKRGSTRYVNEPYVTGGNPVIAGNDVMFNDMLGSTVAINDKAVGMTSFGETAESKAMYTGKPYVDGLGYAFLFRNYRTDLGKWQTVDPLGYPDGWNSLAYVNNHVMMAVDLYGCVNWPTIWRGTKAVLGGSCEIAFGCFCVANVLSAGVTQVAGVLFFMDGLGRVGLGFANITQGAIGQPEVPASYVEVTADIVKQLTDADDDIVDNSAKIIDYAIGLATPTFSGGKIIDILGALGDIATADDAMHDAANSIENLLKNLGVIKE